MARKKNQSVHGAASEESGSRSTALGPMVWLVGLLLTAVTVNGIKGPMWLTIILAGFLGCAGFVFLKMFIFFGETNPDLLRTENYVLRKLQLSKLGDDKAGFQDRTVVISSGDIGANTTPGIEHQGQKEHRL